MQIVEEVKYAISLNIQPQRIQQGSSGSYFCRNRHGQIVGVFKPKNEEPYGKLNPKWTKWLHKTCCPCCFGRSCLIPNLGYISEAAASVVDRALSLNIVPRTEIVSLASPAFYYSYLDKSAAHRNPGLLPPKLGSFQLFMHGYIDATKFLRDGPVMLRDGRLPRDPVSGALDHRLQQHFQQDFENLAILDFVIRNTDRGLDNWMVRFEESEMQEVDSAMSDAQSSARESTLPNAVSDQASDMNRSPTSYVYSPSTYTADVRTIASTDAVKSVAEVSIRSGGGPFTSTYMGAQSAANVSVTPGNRLSLIVPNKESNTMSASTSDNNMASIGSMSGSQKDIVLLSQPSIHIAAIDNGLAFPFKHPDQWRSYPFGWASLPAAKVPFTKTTRDRLMPILTSRRWWEDLIHELRTVFEMDVDFDEKLFRRQVAVMKGQVYNLVHVLQTGIYIDGRDTSMVQPINISPQSSDSTNSQSSTAPMTRQPKSEICGTPLDLIRQAPCLVWEDADVRDLVGGEFGTDVMGRQGFLGTIIGMEQVPQPTTPKKVTSPAFIPAAPSSSTQVESQKVINDSKKKKVRMDDHNIDLERGEKLGDPDDKHIGEFLTLPSDIRDVDATSSQRRRHGRLSAAEISHNLDAFRGRVITFVKQQPWFTNW